MTLVPAIDVEQPERVVMSDAKAVTSSYEGWAANSLALIRMAVSAILNSRLASATSADWWALSERGLDFRLRRHELDAVGKESNDGNHRDDDDARRTETREMRCAGEKLLIGSVRRIEMVRRRPLGLAGARCQPQVGTVRQQTSKWLIKLQNVSKTR